MFQFGDLMSNLPLDGSLNLCVEFHVCLAENICVPLGNKLCIALGKDCCVALQRIIQRNDIFLLVQAWNKGSMARERKPAGLGEANKAPSFGQTGQTTFWTRKILCVIVKHGSANLYKLLWLFSDRNIYDQNKGSISHTNSILRSLCNIDVLCTFKECSFLKLRFQENNG